MRSFHQRIRRMTVGLACATGMMFQLGGCDFGQVTTTVTLSGQELIVTLVRSAILDPIDQWVTDAVNQAFSNDE